MRLRRNKYKLLAVAAFILYLLWPYFQPASTVSSPDYNSQARLSSDEQAIRFRPVLRFDENERWRPLSVDAFLAEGVHRVCAKENSFSCNPIQDVSDLTGQPNGYLDVDGASKDGDDVRGPASCQGTSPVVDCQDSASSAMYVNVTSDDNYNYYDYWFFYRYNKFVSGDAGIADHEGDWEFVTVAAKPGADTFAFVIFSSHKNGPWRYLRSSLTCGSGPAYKLRSCGSEVKPTGQRVNVFVADGSHAGYPHPCKRLCSQKGSPFSGPEKSFGGEQYWKSNDDSTVLKRFPSVRDENFVGDIMAKDASWDTWPGLWGSDGGPLGPAFKPSQRFTRPGKFVCFERWNKNERCGDIKGLS